MTYSVIINHCVIINYGNKTGALREIVEQDKKNKITIHHQQTNEQKVFAV